MDKRGRGGVHSFHLSNGRRFNYYNVSDPNKTEEGNTDPTGWGYRLPAFEFQDICYSYEGGSEILHMLVMERRPLKKNKVTINHFSV